MPELPDVETFRQYLNATALHKKIKEVDVRTPEILEDISASRLTKKLKGKQFEDTGRHGKYLAAFLDSGDCLVLHFGMTGFLKYFKQLDEAPPHVRVLVRFTNGYHLAYDCQRKLGLVALVPNFKEFIRDRVLGPDALSRDWDFSAFKKAASGRRGSIKSFLMNQEVIAGIGNIYADEILFQAKVHPKSPAGKLPDKSLRRLFAAREKVLKTAVKHRANPDKFPRSYITALRGGDGTCPECGGGLKTTKVSGRTAYYCPVCQKQ